MGQTVAQTIKEITRNHLLNNNGLLFGQCLTAVGWVGGTVPDDLPNNKGLEELPTSDVSNGGIVIGAGLAGCRPIYIIRYQGFSCFNLPIILNYAAKSKELWNQICPMFIRGISMEGGIGPVASNTHHSIPCRMPGIKVFAPFTPNEYKEVWNNFVNGDDPIFCSESRKSFNIDYETPNILYKKSDITLLGIGAARLECITAHSKLENMGYRVNLGHIVNLKPLKISEDILDTICDTSLLVIVDSDYQICGIAEHIAYEIYKNERLSADIRALALEDRTAGFAPHCDNITPTADKIVNFVKGLL